MQLWSTGLKEDREAWQDEALREDSLEREKEEEGDAGANICDREGQLQSALRGPTSEGRDRATRGHAASQAGAHEDQESRSRGREKHGRRSGRRPALAGRRS